MKTDKEIRETFKVLFEGDDLVNIIFVEKQKDGEDELRQGQLMLEDVMVRLDKEPDKDYLFLVDLTPMRTGNYIMGRRARDFYKDEFIIFIISSY